MKDGFLKDLLRPFYYTYKRRVEGNRAFQCAKFLLMPGFYYRPFGFNRFVKLDKGFFKIRNLFGFQLWYNRTEGDGLLIEGKVVQSPVSDIAFGIGQGKVVLMTRDKVYGFYHTQNLYMNSKNNCVNNYEKFNYPSVPISGFDDSRRLIIMDFIEGVTYRDRRHDTILVKEMLKYGTSAETITKDGKVLFLQHGDAKQDNVIWNNESLCFIDVDNVNYLPPLFDVFHYLNNCDYELWEVERTIDDNQTLVSQICEKANIAIDDNPKDSLYSGYVGQFAKWGGYFQGILNFFVLLTTRSTPKPLPCCVR